MRRKLIAPAALVGVLLLASHAWAPPPGRPAAPPPPPPPPRPIPIPTPPPRAPGTPSRPPSSLGRPPIILPHPDFAAQLEAARRRNAAEAAELLRQQSAASISRAQRAALLNDIAHQTLRQKQAASLAELRRLRADWLAVGPGAGLDPIVAMQLEAAESAAERLLLADVLKFIRDGQFADADAKLASLESPRYLPAAVVHALPDLRDELRRIAPAVWAQAELRNFDLPLTDLRTQFPDPTNGELAATIGRGADAWATLWSTRAILEGMWDGFPGDKRPVYTVDTCERVLKDVASKVGPGVAKKLRVELAARLYFEGRAKDATQLLEREVDPVHAAAVLADLKTAVFGRGEFTVPQVAHSLPRGESPPDCAAAILPPDQLAKWKLPPAPAVETTVAVAIAEARANVKKAVNAEVAANTARVNAAADRVRAALAAEAGPQKAFVEKVEAALKRPFAAPAERQLAVSAGTHGLTVAETIGVLSAEGDRPAAAVRLLATVPIFTDPGAFAATVELSGRAPAAFAPHADADFKLTAVRDRARIRDTVFAILDRQAAKTAAGQNPPGLDREAFEAAVAKRLGLTDALTAAEVVQGLLDVCRDWADDHARLVATARDLDQIVAGIQSGKYGPMTDELRDLLSDATHRRLPVQPDLKRRAAGVNIGCQLLGGYGAAGAPAIDWLDSQLTGAEKPWHASAALNLARITQDK